MGRYMSRPQEVEAVQWRGDNFGEVKDFGCHVRKSHHDNVQEGWTLILLAGKDGAQGFVDVPVGHWIVRQPGDLTDHWPVEDNYFRAKYEPVENPSMDIPLEDLPDQDLPGMWERADFLGGYGDD